MAGPTYIQVILPLRLEWEPCYRVPEGTVVRIGDRVRVLFARKEYVGAVSAVGVQPQTDENRILPVLAAEEGLPKVLPDEIKFWRAVSDYYLCSIGEVYKAAYPALKIDQEEVEARVKERLEARLERLKDKADKARRDDTRERYKSEIEAVQALLRGEKPAAVPTPVTLSPAQETAAASARKAFESGKTVLLHGVTGSGKTEIYLKLAQETLENRKSPCRVSWKTASPPSSRTCRYSIRGCPRRVGRRWRPGSGDPVLTWSSVPGLPCSSPTTTWG